MRKSNIIIKKVKNLMILSMAVIVIISVYFNILNYERLISCMYIYIIILKILF